MSTAISLPQAEALEIAAQQLRADASTSRQAQIDRALYDLLAQAPAIVRVSGAFLVPSSSRGGIIHRVDDLAGCSCEAGRAGRQCRHTAALELVERAQACSMPALVSPDRAERQRRAAEAAAALNELFA